MFSPEVVKKHVEAASTAGTTTERGRDLEEAVRHLVENVPGVHFLKSNLITRDHSAEFDVTCFNDRHPDGLGFWDEFLLIEAKNWGRKVGAPQIRDFGAKLQAKGRRGGIVFAKHGVSGKPYPPTSAHAEIRNFQQRGISIIVITEEELLALGTPADFANLIRRKWTELVLEISVDFG